MLQQSKPGNSSMPLPPKPPFDRVVVTVILDLRKALFSFLDAQSTNVECEIIGLTDW